MHWLQSVDPACNLFKRALLVREVFAAWVAVSLTERDTAQDVDCDDGPSPLRGQGLAQPNPAFLHSSRIAAASCIARARGSRARGASTLIAASL